MALFSGQDFGSEYVHRLQLFGSAIMKITAGSCNEIYYVHTAAFKRSKSPSLQALASDRWSSAVAEPIDWTHTDPATVARFLSYLYTGDYNVPVPEMRKAQHQPCVGTYRVAEATPKSGEEPAIPSVIPSDKEPQVQDTVSKSFSNRPLTPIKEFVERTKNAEQSMIKSVIKYADYPYTKYHYAASINALARLYCFGVYHLCPSLQSSALSRLTQALAELDCSQSHADVEIAELAEYIYDNTPEGPAAGGPARTLISQFVALNFTNLKGPKLEDLYHRGGGFVTDVMRKVRCQTIAEADTTRLLQKQAADLLKINSKLRYDLAEEKRLSKEGGKSIMLGSTPSSQVAPYTHLFSFQQSAQTPTATRPPMFPGSGH